MEAPSPRYILTRATFLIGLLVAVLFGYGHLKKYQRKQAIIAGLQSITSDSSFFQQFYADDARKSLVRAVGLIAEANTLGIPPDQSINRGIGISEKFFATDADHQEPPAREKIIRNSLRGNYENFLKLGYKPDFHTLADLAKGELPSIPDGPHAGRRPEVVNIISPVVSPGLEKVIANLELRPPQADDGKLTDIQTAAAKQLARDLCEAGVIEEPVREKILLALTQSTP